MDIQEYFSVRLFFCEMISRFYSLLINLNRNKLVKILESKVEPLKTFDGLKYVRLVAVSDMVTVAIFEYESEELLDKVESRFRVILIYLIPLMSGPLEVHNGDVYWDHRD